MANRVFQSVIYQMKDAIDRVVGVVDETGAVISCSELNLIGEVREGFMAERLTAGDRFVRDGYTYQQFSSAKHNDYAVFVEGADETAGQFAALLSISLQSIKQYHDEKFDKANFIKNVVLDNILPGDIYAKARELQREMLPLADALFCEVNPIPVKYAMNVLGWEAGECRLPLVEPSEAHKEQIEKALRAEGLITE